VTEAARAVPRGVSRPRAIAAPRATSRVWKRAVAHRTFLLGLVLTGGIVAVAALSLAYTPRDPLQMEIAARLQGPSAAHPLGTDQYGRDLLSRIMRGAVASLAVGGVAVTISMGVGVFLGLAAGWVGGWLDEGVMRLMDAVYGFPAVLSALLLAAAFGPGVLLSMVAVGVASMPIFARLARASVLGLKELDFVAAARALGAGDAAILRRHIGPNTLSPLIVQATVTFPVAILAEAALSYLGLGTQPPNPSWGLMLKESQSFLALSPWFAVFPGGAIALAVLGFNLLGDGLRDLLDPRG
jgi:peptide/nickel transport system permease protein